MAQSPSHLIHMPILQFVHPVGKNGGLHFEVRARLPITVQDDFYLNRDLRPVTFAFLLREILRQPWSWCGKVCHLGLQS